MKATDQRMLRTKPLPIGASTHESHPGLYGNLEGSVRRGAMLVSGAVLACAS